MIEVFVLVGVIIGLMLLILRKNINLTQKLIFEQEREIKLFEDKLNIVEKKFLQGKIKKQVYENLKDDLTYNKILKELDNFRLKKMNTFLVEDKLEKLLEKINSPTRHKKAKLKSLILESEVLRKEMNIIEKKLLKNEISEENFSRLISQKENEIIEKEAQVINFIKNDS